MTREKYTDPGVEEYARKADWEGRNMAVRYGSQLTWREIGIISAARAIGLPDRPSFVGTEQALLLATSHITSAYMEMIRARRAILGDREAEYPYR